MFIFSDSRQGPLPKNCNSSFSPSVCFSLEPPLLNPGPADGKQCDRCRLPFVGKPSFFTTGIRIYEAFLSFQLFWSFLEGDGFEVAFNSSVSGPIFSNFDPTFLRMT